MFRSLCVACLLPSSVALRSVGRRSCPGYGMPDFGDEFVPAECDTCDDRYWLCEDMPWFMNTGPCPMNGCDETGEFQCGFIHGTLSGSCQPPCDGDEYEILPASGWQKALRACPFVDSATTETKQDFPDAETCVMQVTPGDGVNTRRTCRLEVVLSTGTFSVDDCEDQSSKTDFNGNPFPGCKKGFTYYPDAKKGAGGTWKAQTARTLQPVTSTRRLAERKTTERDQRRRFSPILFVGLCSVDVPGIDVTAINQRENCNNDDGGWKCYDENLDFSCCSKGTLAECTS